MDENWQHFSEFPVVAPVVVRNDDERWVYHHTKHDKPIETPCTDLERSMLWYYLTEIIEASAEEIEAKMEGDDLPEEVFDFVAIRIPIDELR